MGDHDYANDPRTPQHATPYRANAQAQESPEVTPQRFRTEVVTNDHGSGSFAIAINKQLNDAHARGYKCVWQQPVFVNGSSTSIILAFEQRDDVFYIPNDQQPPSRGAIRALRTLIRTAPVHPPERPYETVGSLYDRALALWAMREANSDLALTFARAGVVHTRAVVEGSLGQFVTNMETSDD